MATFTLDWSETNIGGSAVVSYDRGAVLDFTDKPAGATSALSLAANRSDSANVTIAEYEIETTGSSTLTFAYHTSTESGYDKLHIDVDGVSRANYSGETAWTTHAGIAIASAGTHTIRFRYEKDGSGAGGQDRVWVALLNVTNTVAANDASGTVDLYDMEDAAIPDAVVTSTWTNSTSAPIAGSRSLRTPASPANNGSYDLEVTNPAGADYSVVSFEYKVSSEPGYDRLAVFPDATAANVPASGYPSTPGGSGWLAFSGTASGRVGLILPAAESAFLLRYAKDGGGATGADAAWIDNLRMPTVSGGGPVDLVVADTSHGHTADVVTLTQAHSLAVADAGHSHTADLVALTQTHVLTVADLTHGHTTEAVALTQTHILTTADTSHTQTADTVTLQSGATLTVADSHHAHTTDTATLTQAHTLTVADLTHVHTADLVQLAQAHALVVLDTLHTHTIDTVTVVDPSTISPTPAARTHAIAAERRTLTISGENRTTTVAAENRTVTA